MSLEREMPSSRQRIGVGQPAASWCEGAPWLFDRMRRYAREIIIVMVGEFGCEEMLRRLSDPYWFQARGCVLGYDWHSSGVTTAVCGAIKEGLRGLESKLGLFVAGRV